MDLSNFIKSKACELGFQVVGISSPELPPNHLQYYDDWLTVNKNGTMKWLENRKEERKDIFKYFPEVKSVVSVAINYYTGLNEQFSIDVGESAKISNYAWGKDYHIIVKYKLEELLHYINIELNQNVKGMTCVDTSPVMEKQWAQHAGVGWQGKHTLIINKEFGSWLFLGEILLDIPLEYDMPFEINLCGSCTACIDACPTNALTDYQLDATKCISYLTVEYKENFNSSQKKQLNSWIYGCDICQQVCPWNKKQQQESTEKSFQPISQIYEYSKTNWEKLTENSFKDIFNDSPIKRIKYNRFKRNIAAIK